MYSMEKHKSSIPKEAFQEYINEEILNVNSPIKYIDIDDIWVELWPDEETGSGRNTEAYILKGTLYTSRGFLTPDKSGPAGFGPAVALEDFQRKIRRNPFFKKWFGIPLTPGYDDFFIGLSGEIVDEIPEDIQVKIDELKGNTIKESIRKHLRKTYRN